MLLHSPVTQHMNPLKVLDITDRLLDDKCVMVADGGDFIGSAAYIVRPRGPLKYASRYDL